MPVRCLKYLPNDDCVGKLSAYDTCCIFLPEKRSMFFASISTKSSIHLAADCPVASFTSNDRYLGEINNLLA